MLITQQDVDGLLHFAALSAATRCGIPEAEWETTDTIVEAVRAKNKNVADTLKQFIQAYRAWFDFHKRIENEDESGNIGNDGNLVGLIIDRDRTRLRFITALKSAA